MEHEDDKRLFDQSSILMPHGDGPLHKTAGGHMRCIASPMQNQNKLRKHGMKTQKVAPSDAGF